MKITEAGPPTENRSDPVKPRLLVNDKETFLMFVQKTAILSLFGTHSHSLGETNIAQMFAVEAGMAGSFARAFAVFCIALGGAYGAVKFLTASPQTLYLAPVLGLLYLGADILIRQWRSNPRERRKHRRVQK